MRLYFARRFKTHKILSAVRNCSFLSSTFYFHPRASPAMDAVWWDAPCQVIVAVVSTRIVKEVRPWTECMSWYYPWICLGQKERLFVLHSFSMWRFVICVFWKRKQGILMSSIFLHFLCAHVPTGLFENVCWWISQSLSWHCSLQLLLLFSLPLVRGWEKESDYSKICFAKFLQSRLWEFRLCCVWQHVLKSFWEHVLSFWSHSSLPGL